ncbi:unnamed protein product [Psylliodes chrysocephalus]|uniref:Uncharacterized protein n=1 Tax=Psylliodes chrysocephalus TaxID=3402493 RepID=A0A9P0CV00_9CUCU|nr:unnamed protein product [Psylliodes chrysocephala]
MKHHVIMSGGSYQNNFEFAKNLYILIFQKVFNKMVKRSSDQSKTLILNVVSYFKKHKSICEALGKRYNQIAAEVLNISQKTIYRLSIPTNSDTEYVKIMTKKSKPK